jgi:hypothetical protein
MRFGSSQNNPGTCDEIWLIAKQPMHLRLDLAHRKNTLFTCDEVWLIAKITWAPAMRFGSSQKQPWHMPSNRN